MVIDLYSKWVKKYLIYQQNMYNQDWNRTLMWIIVTVAIPLDIRIKDSSRKKLVKTPWVQNYGEDIFGVDEWWSRLIIKYWTLIHEINPEVSCIYISDKWVLCISIRLSSHHKANHFLRVGPVTIKRIRRKKLLGRLLWKKYSFSMDST